MTFCHRKAERCFHIFGKKMPLCSRCLGLYTGMCLGAPILYGDVEHPWWLGLLLIPPAFYDGWKQMTTHYQSNNRRRLLTGIVSGFGMMLWTDTKINALFSLPWLT